MLTQMLLQRFRCRLVAKSEEEKLHSMLAEKHGVQTLIEEPDLAYGPFTYAFSCLAKYVAAASGR
jgi:hypothetical protein